MSGMTNEPKPCMHLDDLTIFKKRKRGSKQEREAHQIAHLLYGLTFCMQDLADVKYVSPDPPDFSLHLASGTTVGIELTELVRSPSLHTKGDKQYRVAFPKWQADIKQMEGTIEAEFAFSPQSVPAMFQQFRRQFAEKQRLCSGRRNDFSELWLAFHIPISNPMGMLTTYQWRLDKLGDLFARLWGRFLYDAHAVVARQEVFQAVIFFSDTSHLALTPGATVYGGTLVNQDLLALGMTVPDAEYESYKVAASHQVRQNKWVRKKGDLGT